MKKAIFVQILALVLMIGCATVPPQIINFNATPQTIEESGKVVVQWDVSNAERVSITNIGENLPLSGQKEIFIDKTTSFVLEIKNGNLKNSKELIVQVVPRKKETPISKPVVENRSTTEQKYLKGIVNAENVKESDRPELYINLIDSKNFPNKVKLFCTIKDKYGNHIANLAPPYNYETKGMWKDLVEIINGKNKTIKDFEVQEIREEDAPPFSSTFVLDYSGSMDGDYSFVDAAMRKVVNFIRKNKDDFQVIQFDHKVKLSVPQTNNPSEISKMLPFQEMGGYTAFYDASILGINNISNSNKEKVAILFTDGGDNSSWFNVNNVISVARKSGTKVFVIGFNREFGGFIDAILNAITLQTGGKVYYPSTLKELDDIFAEIYQIMKVYYLITYTTESSTDVWRIAKIGLKLPQIQSDLVAEKKYYTQQEKIEENKIIDVVNFESGKYAIEDQFIERINFIAEQLVKDPSIKIEIIGHTDTRGSDALNNNLSKKRANALAQLLFKKGVSKKQIIKIDGLGKKQPIYPNEINDIERRQNRRVTIKII